MKLWELNLEDEFQLKAQKLFTKLNRGFGCVFDESSLKIKVKI